jgi:hypothetical protein
MIDKDVSKKNLVYRINLITDEQIQELQKKKKSIYK